MGRKINITIVAALAAGLIFAVPAKAETPFAPQGSAGAGLNLSPVAQWLILTAKSEPVRPKAATANSNQKTGNTSAVSQWIALTWLFGGGNNFNNLDQVSKWIVLSGLFGQ